MEDLPPSRLTYFHRSCIGWCVSHLGNSDVSSFDARVGTGESPLACLRPALLHLQDPKSLASICGRLLGLLKQDPALSDAPPPSFSSSVDDATAEFRPDYVQSLGAHLLGSAALYSLRKRLLIASVCAVSSAST